MVDKAERDVVVSELVSEGVSLGHLNNILIHT